MPAEGSPAAASPVRPVVIRGRGKEVPGRGSVRRSSGCVDGVIQGLVRVVVIGGQCKAAPLVMSATAVPGFALVRVGKGSLVCRIAGIMRMGSKTCRLDRGTGVGAGGGDAGPPLPQRHVAEAV